jgi:hypothetical protein
MKEATSLNILRRLTLSEYQCQFRIVAIIQFRTSNASPTIFQVLTKSQIHRSKSSLDVAIQLKYIEMFRADVAFLPD